jgi:hypothetical protein
MRIYPIDQGVSIFMSAPPMIENEMLSLGVYALMVRGQNQDILMGKSVQHYLVLPGLENLLQYFIADLDKAFSFVYNNDIAGFLNELESDFHLNFMPLQENMEENIKNMQDFENDEIMVWYLIITKMLETMREQVFAEQGWAILGQDYENRVSYPLSEEVKTKINELDAIDNEDLSILYNLVFVKYLAELYSQIEVKTEIDDQIQVRVNHLLDLILT